MPCDIRVNTDIMIASASPFCVPSLRYGLDGPCNCSQNMDMTTKLFYGLTGPRGQRSIMSGFQATISLKNTEPRYKGTGYFSTVFRAGLVAQERSEVTACADMVCSTRYTKWRLAAGDDARDDAHGSCLEKTQQKVASLFSFT
jgi:hypothetical protein